MLVISASTFGFLSSTTVPLLTCANRVHPLLRFAPLQSPAVSSDRLSYRPLACSRVKSSFLGVRVPSSRHPPSASNAPSHSHLPGAFPSSAFLTPSTVSSASGFVGLFHPTATSRVHSAGVCLLVRNRFAFQRPLPSRRCLELAIGSCPPTPLVRASPSGISSASESLTQASGVSRCASQFPS